MLVHLSLTTQEQKMLERMARDEALMSLETHAYLPRTAEEADRFEPHMWVLEAIARAYMKGRTDGRTATRTEIRNMLGLQ